MNAWSLAGGAVWGSLGAVTLLEELKRVFRVKKTPTTFKLLSASFLWFKMGSSASYTAAVSTLPSYGLLSLWNQKST